jgi:hypothetical protein
VFDEEPKVRKGVSRFVHEIWGWAVIDKENVNGSAAYPVGKDLGQDSG